MASKRKQTTCQSSPLTDEKSDTEACPPTPQKVKQPRCQSIRTRADQSMAVFWTWKLTRVCDDVVQPSTFPGRALRFSSFSESECSKKCELCGIFNDDEWRFTIGCTDCVGDWLSMDPGSTNDEGTVDSTMRVHRMLSIPSDGTAIHVRCPAACEMTSAVGLSPITLPDVQNGVVFQMQDCC